ncbi:aldehyde oxidoreductase, partial [Marinilabiliaceae bacterium JC017]
YGSGLDGPDTAESEYGSGLDGPDTAESEIELNKDGSVTLFNCWHDHGQGADIGCLGTAHEALRPLGLTPEQIHLVMNDTRNCPNGGPAGGSRSQVVIGNAIIAACRNLMDAMRKADNSYMSYDELVAANKA